MTCGVYAAPVIIKVAAILQDARLGTYWGQQLNRSPASDFPDFTTVD